MQESEQDATPEAEVEITDLDPATKSSRTGNRREGGQRFFARARLGMALFTLLGAALFSWLLVSQWPVTEASHQPPASTRGSFTTPHLAPLHYAQMVIFQHVIYLLDQDGVLKALWTRHKYMYLLWQHAVGPFSLLLRVDQNVVYLAGPHGSRFALRTSDGTVLWAKKKEAS